ncbi:DUF262 domain-containing protein [Paenibacillus tarimensis]|uniref:DUF262 domain-containing protein n=1 Tax=Paenibacillus tarimensis TaxID=416012 RepID=UPI001F40584D|nr:DUF262 domain-containing protein [Paenibacillus tarimensis]MCF2946323.1 DUF262 domain-containing protein [Paenibacillus tarimensis]
MFEITRAKESTIKEWYFRKDSVDFNPEYQRVSSVWSTENKQLLIDSIINGLDLPKFYLHYFPSRNNPLNDKQLTYAIIDGKQRMETIIDFLDGGFRLHRDFVYYQDSDVNLSGMNFQEITQHYPKIQYHIYNYLLDVVLVVTDEREKIDELFLRLNEGKQLNSAEKRNAISGYITDKIRHIASTHTFFTEKVSFKNKRYDYYDVLVRLFFLEFHIEELIPFTKTNLDRFVRNNRTENSLICEAVEKAITKLDVMTGVFIEKDPLLNNKSIIPAYYLFINNVSGEDIREFLVEFERIRKLNRTTEDPEKNTVLLEFDRLTQQGSSKVVSMKNRFEILKEYLKLYRENNGNLSHLMPVNIDELVDSDDD